MVTGPRRRPSRAGSVVLAALCFGLVSAPPASASRAAPTIFDAGVYLTGEATADQRAGRLDELRRLGADTLRVIVHWRDFAPDPGSSSRQPGFDAADPREYPGSGWVPLDQLVRGARARGLRVLLTPSGPIPDWASSSAGWAGGHAENVFDPEPAEFRRFVTALGRRYSGVFVPLDPVLGGPCSQLFCVDPPAPLPRVDFWAAWNEPNLGEFLAPQFRGGRPYSPLLYRRLFLAAQAGLRSSGHGEDPLLIGETATAAGRGGVAPMLFVRRLFCLDLDYRPVRFCRAIEAAGWGHHPYGYSFPPHLRSPNRAMVNIARLGRLTRGLRKAAEAGATTRVLDVYITEFGVLTVPTAIGVGLERQVEWLAISEYLAWRNPRVRSWAQYLLRDDPPHFESKFTSGLRFNDGRPKLAYRAFPITLMVRAIGGGRVRGWGHVRPGAAPLEVGIRARRPGRRPVQLRRVVTDSRGYFGFTARARRGRRWQARAVLRGGRRLSGPFVRAYRFP